MPEAPEALLILSEIGDACQYQGHQKLWPTPGCRRAGRSSSDVLLNQSQPGYGQVLESLDA
jgi:hypothetical protein